MENMMRNHGKKTNFVVRIRHGNSVDSVEPGGLHRGNMNSFDTPPSPELRRRPIRVRDTRLAHSLARAAARAGLRPNGISVLSVVCAVLGAGAFVASGYCDGVLAKAAWLLGAGFCVQMRLLCNLLDGLVAVEGGLRTASGEIYNELPDRISDALFLAAAGYATHRNGWGPDLGWAAAVSAVIVAYVRALGGQAGAAQQFCGPMAKQQRMFLLTLACALTATEAALGWPPRAMVWALALIALGSAATAARRTVRIVRELESKGLGR
jgi:phosphatidylglycerophosphate synthase